MSGQGPDLRSLRLACFQGEKEPVLRARSYTEHAENLRWEPEVYLGALATAGAS